MKKRIVKKYINRYITKVVKELPRVDTWAYQEIADDEDNGVVTAVYANNHTIANGEYQAEGTRSNKCENLLKNIKLTGLKAREIINSHRHPHLRLFEIRGSQVRMRIITE